MSDLEVFYNFKYFILIFIGSFSLLLVNYSPKEILRSFNLAIKGKGAEDNESVANRDIWYGAARSASMLGSLGLVLEVLFFFQDMMATGRSGYPNPTRIFAHGIQPLIHGLIIAGLFIILAWRMENRLGNETAANFEKNGNPLIWKIIGIAILLISLSSHFLFQGISDSFFSWPALGILFGGTLVVYFLSSNVFSITPTLCLLGFIIAIWAISGIFLAMGPNDYLEVGKAIKLLIRAIFYALIGITIIAIPIEDNQLRQGRSLPLLNRLLYLLIPIFTLATYFFIFIILILPTDK